MIKHFRSVDEFAPEAWDRLARGADIALSFGWVRITETTGDAETIYFALERTGSMVGVLPATIAQPDAPWLLTRTDAVLVQCADDGDESAGRIRASLTTEPAEALLPGLVLGGRHAGRTSLVQDPSLTEDEIDELIASAEDFARSRDLKSLAFLYVDDRDEKLRACLEARGYERWVSGIDSDLSLPGGGFEPYLAQFPSRRRSKIRIDRKLVMDSTFRIRSIDLSDETLWRAAELEHMLFAKYGIDNWSTERSYRGLTGARENLNRPFIVVAEDEDGEMIGFSLVAEFHGEWYAVRAGFDYDKQNGVPLYYELVYYSLIEMAGSEGVTKIHYGMGSVKAKAIRGCVGTVQHGYLKQMG